MCKVKTSKTLFVTSDVNISALKKRVIKFDLINEITRLEITMPIKVIDYHEK